MDFVNGNIAKEIGKLHDWPGKFWKDRYHHIVVSDEDAAQVSRLEYFPLSSESFPNRETLERGWDAPLNFLRQLSARHGDKPVIFAEIGYDLSSVAASEPWKTASRNTDENRALRRRLINTALDRIEGEDFIAGMFWWKWMPGTRAGFRDFSMRDPEAKELLRQKWLGR